jgi:hypothetical protein
MARKIRLGGCSAEKKRFRRSADGEVMVATDDIIDATAVITLACRGHSIVGRTCDSRVDSRIGALSLQCSRFFRSKISGIGFRESLQIARLASRQAIRSVFVELRGRCHDLVNCSPNSVRQNLLRPHAQKQSLHRPYYRQQLVEIVRRAKLNTATDTDIFLAEIIFEKENYR